MDPFRNAALQSAKLQSLLSSRSSEHPRRESETSVSNMPAPPAYHMVVDANAPIPNHRTPYDEEDEDEEEERDADDGDEDDDPTPAVTIHAATQVRGHGNIISIAQIDTVRVANLIATMLNGDTRPPVASSTAATPCPRPPPATHSNPATNPFPSSPPFSSSSLPSHQPARKLRKVNITINCGATVIGDRNVVGPGLGDIARHMQLTQRNQALQAAQQQRQPAPSAPQLGISIPKTPDLGAAAGADHGGGGGGGGGVGVGVGVTREGETLHQAQVATPPMSRSTSERSDEAGGLKRKRKEETGEVCVKKPC